MALSAVTFAQSAPNTLSPEEQQSGFKLLFDGTKVLGLRGVQKSDFLRSGWKIADGALVLEKSIQMSGKVTGGDLMTVDSFVDFDFHFEWKSGVSGNSGILYFVKTTIGKPV